jgi:hypothetical protein
VEILVNHYVNEFQTILKEWMDNSLIESNFSFLNKDLKLLYKLISLSSMVSEKLIKDFESIIEMEGVEEIQKLKLDPNNFVSCVMKIHTKSTSFITQSFSNDSNFITARNNVSIDFFLTLKGIKEVY